MSTSSAVTVASIYALIDCWDANFVAELDAILSSSKNALPETAVFNTALVSTGDVKVLFVRVSEPAIDTKESLCNALLNSDIEPVKLLPEPPKSKVLFVSVSVVALPTRVSVALKNVIVLSAVGSTNATVVSLPLSVEPSKTRGLAPEKTNPVKSCVPVNEPLNVPPLIVGLVSVLL